MRTLKNVLLGCGLFLLAILYDLYTRRQDMSRDTKKVIKWWLIAVLALGVIRLLSGCRAVTTPIITSPGWSGNQVAETTCSADNRPVIVMRVAEWDSTEYHIMLIHEETHVRQMQKDCHKAQKAYQDSLSVKIRMEAEAYCEDSKARIKAGQNPMWVRERFFGLMQQLYGSSDPPCDLFQR